MKSATAFFLTIFSAGIVHAQLSKIDSLQKKPSMATDTTKANILNRIADEYYALALAAPAGKETDSLVLLLQSYTTEAKSFSEKIHYDKGIGRALATMGNAADDFKSDKHTALSYYLSALPYFKKQGDKKATAELFYRISDCYHITGNLNEAILYADSAINISGLADDNRNKTAEYVMSKGHYYYDKGDYKTAYDIGNSALKLAEQTKDTTIIILSLAHLNNLFLGADLPQVTIDYMHKIIQLYPDAMDSGKKASFPFGVSWGLIHAGEAFLKLNQVDSALKIAQLVSTDLGWDAIMFYGHLYMAQGKTDKALAEFLIDLKAEEAADHKIGIARAANELGNTYLQLKKYDSAIYYAKRSLAVADSIHALLEKREAANTLSNIYIKTKNYEKVYQYSSWYKALNDSLAPDEYRQKLSLIQVQTELDQQKQQALLLGKENELKNAETKRTKNLLWLTALFGIIIAGFQYWNNRQKLKAKQKIEKAYSELKSTQAQLIQSEKMASLGQLTAGIAHEIQNPLNFVNNFSEVNKELVQELKSGLAAGNSQLVAEIANDIQDNSEKINHHGRRAEAIVKGMLQHSRKNTGQKEPANINALCDEYLRLAYHGLRAKDKSFNATMKTDFDENIGKINIVPQDMGRALLNLINNAFYAVNEKIKQNIAGYEPIVIVSTKKEKDKVEIKIGDNGNGIPQNIIDKIFQPFFTTKPTGSGTGLGLSLSYDIVKAHGGEIKVESKEGKGSKFIIQLPV